MREPKLCSCEQPTPLYIWRDDPDWWACSYCDHRVRPVTDEERAAIAERPFGPFGCDTPGCLAHDDANTPAKER